MNIRKSFSTITMIFMAISVFLLIFLAYSHYRVSQKEVFGNSIASEDIIFEYEKPFAFGANYFAITITRLDEESANYFQSPPPYFFSDYPQIRPQEKSYRVSKWRHTPACYEDIQRLQLLLSEKEIASFIDEETEVRIKLYTIQAAQSLVEDGNLYAYYASKENRFTELFLIDIHKKLLTRIQQGRKP